jgi:hypothetical protein
MYQPKTPQKLINDGLQFLLSIENKVDVSSGLDTILLLDELYKMYPDININESIKGHKFRNFIVEMHKRFGNNSIYQDELPFMPYNIRHGLYKSITGLIAEYMSYVVTQDKFRDVRLLQDYYNQSSGNDIEYKHNNNYITADIKLSSTNWLRSPIIKCHGDWFADNKTSTRFHIVDIYNGVHLIVGRTHLISQYKKYGNIIKLSVFNSNICNIKYIESYTKLFRS